MLSYAVDFKLKLEKLLADMVIVSEIADLAAEVDILNDEVPPDEKSDGENDALINLPKPGSNKKGLSVWSNVDFEKTHESFEEEEDKKALREPHLRRSPSGNIQFKSRLEKWNEPTTHDKVKPNL